MITFTSFPKHAGKTIAFFFFSKKRLFGKHKIVWKAFSLALHDAIK